MPIPDGSEMARPFLPARDFAVSKAFYRALGFTQVFDGAVALFSIGATGFILQNFYQEDWAENFMMQLVVDDIDGWWAHIQALDLPASFGVQAPTPPLLQPWGMTVAHVFDPSGVLWHVVKRPQTQPGTGG